ncbi:lipoprotein [uncultured Caudovirales phage]|uniref:Lipoprotein n=1 Tax=uncultured Caudovirales phage TaxID=2100421 RepID=A0A6J5MYV6_9CAUD|nr:lipoprotein [uncultured Caudovirales phage]
MDESKMSTQHKLSKYTQGALLVLLAASFSTVKADSWTGKDKQAHAIVGAAVGTITTMVTKDSRTGCAASAGIGLAKEVYDSQNRATHTVSFKDFAVTAIAGCLTAAGTGWSIIPKEKGMNIAYTYTF